jgi:hypothetical protein
MDWGLRRWHMKSTVKPKGIPASNVQADPTVIKPAETDFI